MKIFQNRVLVWFGILLLTAVGCRSDRLGKNEYADAEASAAEAAELDFFAKRQLPSGAFPGTSRLLSTALVVRCFLEASITPCEKRHGGTVESGLDFLVQQVEQQERPLASEDDAVELRVAVWTLVMAYGETKNPNVLSAVRKGVSRLDQWNGRTHFSPSHTEYDEYQRMGMESLILLELRGAGIGCQGSVFAESLEKSVRGADRHRWFDGIGALRLAFDVHGIDPFGESLRTGVICGMTSCALPPAEVSPDHFRVVERLCFWRWLERDRCQFKPQLAKEAAVPKEVERHLAELQREMFGQRLENMKTYRALSINNLRKLDRSDDDAIREAALLVLEMPRPQWGWYFRRPFPTPEVDLVPNRR